jgi:hypothetical protein
MKQLGNRMLGGVMRVFGWVMERRGVKNEEVGQKKKFQTVHFSIDRGDFPIDRENAKVGQFILLLIETTSLSIETISQSIERLVFEKKFSNRIKPNDVLSFFKPDFHSLVLKKKKNYNSLSLRLRNPSRGKCGKR